MHEVFINVEKCKGCTYCVLACPQKCLQIGENFNSRGYLYPEWVAPERCKGCASCVRLCPDFAIEVYENSERER